MTELDGGSRLAFTEPIDQVKADIEYGYEYRTATGSRLAVVAGAVVVDGQNLVGAVAVLDDLPWDGWAELAESDADYYRRQRNP